MHLADYKVDVIIPTADVTKWPASASIPWNARLTSRLPNVHYIPIESSGPNFSFAKSVNKGMKECREDSDILLLNDDVFMDHYYIHKFWDAMTTHFERCGIYGATLRFPTEIDRNQFGNTFSGRGALNHWYPEYQHAGGYIPVTFKEMLYGLVRFGFWNASPLFEIRQGIKVPEAGFRFPGHYHHLKKKNRIDLITAAAMLITRETYDVLGYFDERYPLGFEDTDYSLSALEYCIGLCLVSNCQGIHYESATSRHLEERKRESYKIFYKKWDETRIKYAIHLNKYSMVHPLYCGCEIID